MADSLDSTRGALRTARDELLARPNVVATGVGYKIVGGERTGELSIVCSVVRKVPRAELTAAELVPERVAGVPTDVVATGRFRALEVPMGRFRPAPGGVSIGHRDITSGTLGCVVRKDGELFILSNNHVLANSNAAQIGDPILQPGPYDGGRDPDDRIATLSAFTPIAMMGEESTCGTARAVADGLNALSRLLSSDARLRAVSQAVAENLVDCAIARPLSTDLVADEILGLGAIVGTGSGELGLAVRKSGRTTGVTSGEIVQVDVTADVNYGNQSARFSDQLMAGPMSQGGDSGSAILDGEGRVVGLLFAGSDTTTLANRIGHVFSALGVRL